MAVDYLLNRASAAEIAEHLRACDLDFVPPLSPRIDIEDYARKIAGNAIRFEAWSDRVLVGLVAAYCNDRNTRVAHITSVSVLKAWTGRMIAARLVAQFVDHARASGMRRINLKVGSGNTRAIKLYSKHGFVAGVSDAPSIGAADAPSIGAAHAPFISMDLYLENGERHEQQA